MSGGACHASSGSALPTLQNLRVAFAPPEQPQQPAIPQKDRNPSHFAELIEFTPESPPKSRTRPARSQSQRRGVPGLVEAQRPASRQRDPRHRSPARLFYL